jgi:molecular chaperone Hsp33
MRVFRLYPVEHHCPYDEGKVKNLLLGLGREEVESILAEKGEVVIRNEMCNHEYRFDAGRFRRYFHPAPAITRLRAEPGDETTNR